MTKKGIKYLFFVEKILLPIYLFLHKEKDFFFLYKKKKNKSSKLKRKYDSSYLPIKYNNLD